MHGVRQCGRTLDSTHRIVVKPITVHELRIGARRHMDGPFQDVISAFHRVIVERHAPEEGRFRGSEIDLAIDLSL